MFWKKITLLRLCGFRLQTDLGWLVLTPFMVWALGSGLFPLFFKGYASVSYWIMGSIGFLLLMLSFTVHELGQALVARRFGLKVKNINLSLCGGISELNAAPPHPHAELLITIAGALISLGLSGLSFGLALAAQAQGWPQGLLALLRYLGIINTTIALFHLLPAFPLDGGRLLRASLWHWRANLIWATRVAADVGVFFGLSFIFLGLIVSIAGNPGGLWWMLIGFLLRNSAEGSFHQLLRQAGCLPTHQSSPASGAASSCPSLARPPAEAAGAAARLMTGPVEGPALAWPEKAAGEHADTMLSTARRHLSG